MVGTDTGGRPGRPVGVVPLVAGALETAFVPAGLKESGVVRGATVGAACDTGALGIWGKLGCGGAVGFEGGGGMAAKPVKAGAGIVAEPFGEPDELVSLASRPGNLGTSTPVLVLCP